MRTKTYLCLIAGLLVVAVQLKGVIDDFIKAGEYQVGDKLYELFLPAEPYVYNNVTIPSHYLADSIAWMTNSSTINSIAAANNPNFVAPLLFSAPPLPQNNDLVTLGRVLFYDKNLSANQQIACASCHKQNLGFADNKNLSDGFMGETTRRNSPAIADIPLTIHYRGLLWDKRKDNLEEMIELPIKDEVEMGMQFSDLVTRLQGLDYYAPLFQNAYGSNEINQARITHALADFVRTLLPDNTKLDQGIASNFANFSNQEINGLLLFQRDCWHCHTSVPMANEDLSELTFPNINAMVSHPYNNGLSLNHATDQGFGEVSGLSSDVGRFNSPSLKNIALSAPYMHDGSLATLEDVVDFYSEEIKPDPNSFFSVANYYGTLSLTFTGFNYSDDEKASLVAFMRTLTDSSFISNPIYSNPFTETIVNSVSQIDPNLVEGVSPNPMTNSAIVRFENPAGKVTNIRLSNTEGRVVLVGASTDNSYTIDRQNLPAGLYIVSVEQGNKRAMSKLLIE